MSSLMDNFEQSSSRQDWIKWMCGILTAIALLAASWYLFSDALFLLTVLAFIMGFFTISLIRSFLDVSVLDREARAATRQVDQLEKINDIARFVQTADDTIFRKHIQSLYTIFKVHSDIAQDNLIEIMHARLSARNKHVELFASTLVTLGLIGTIVGLIDSTSGLGDAMTQMFNSPAENATDGVAVAVESGTVVVPTDGPEEDANLLGNAMAQTFGGLKTAFYTTLLGSLLGGVVLRLLTNVVDSAITRYTAHVAELTEVHVLPALRRSAAKLQAEGYYDGLG